MYEIKKTFEVAIAHRLNLPYDSPCQRCHGHNLLITVWIRSDYLDGNDMVLDFTYIKEEIHGSLDHSYLNEDIISNGDFVKKQPTAENIAYWICTQVSEMLEAVNPSGKCYRVDIQESTGNIASYIDDSVEI